MTYEQAMIQLKELADRGWRLSIDLNGPMVDNISGHAGDSHCSHRKEYDPSDGHGTSYFDTESVALFPQWYLLTEEGGVTFPVAVDFAYHHIMSIAPGAPR